MAAEPPTPILIVISFIDATDSFHENGGCREKKYRA